MGAAYLAGLAVGYWESKYEIEKNWKRERTFEPMMQNDLRQELLAGWKKAIDCSRNWAKP
jgi:glycerol kinase